MAFSTFMRHDVAERLVRPTLYVVVKRESTIPKLDNLVTLLGMLGWWISLDGGTTAAAVVVIRLRKAGKMIARIILIIEIPSISNGSKNFVKEFLRTNFTIFCAQKSPPRLVALLVYKRLVVMAGPTTNSGSGTEVRMEHSGRKSTSLGFSSTQASWTGFTLESKVGPIVRRVGRLAIWGHVRRQGQEEREQVF